MPDGKRNDAMKAFKIQDAVKKTVDGRPKVAAPAAPAASAGFPAIEAVVEQNGEAALAGLKARSSQLAQLAKSAKSPKDKAAAQRALKAYDKTQALVSHLLATKAGMGAGSTG